ncbi:hypothetical protein EZV73_03360 [Acidaminobacter sp. JC074]|uniref:hypothetical protein n=1 Tax=Acidaminobacter sp. JC074 TaxID=2530199 RepID=UPI001F0D0BD5|nr:hypothetical protein [Acidaminobacter sp. JC074]MCH4886588.1 hypothetical protein [Acidaminobacter sp. JC074]
MSIYFKKLKEHSITGLVFAVLALLTALFLLDKITLFDMVMAFFFGGLSLLYFNYHRFMYLRYDDKTLYLYRGIFRKLMSVKLEGVRIITILGQKVRILTKDGKELIVNLSFMSKIDSEKFTSFLQSHIPNEKWV